MSKPSWIIVLAEDQHHQRFVRMFLYRSGFKLHDIRFEPLPNGRGCGEQWVRERYPIAVKAYRARAARAKTALVVVIDADNYSVEDRQRQLRELIQCEATEAIVHLIPKRNIEAWILFLTGTSVDEQTDYSHDDRVDDLIKDAAHRFFEAIQPGAAPIDSAIPSLQAAIPEARRLR